MDLDEVAGELYGLPREEFTPTRDERVKAARASGDRELAAAIGKLRRPSAAAWLVNQLARREPERLGALASLGERMRAAHEQLDGEALRRLSGQRRELINDLVGASRELGQSAGTPVSDAVGRELEDLFVAGLADADAARLLASGRMSSPKELAEAATLRWPAVAPDARPRPAPVTERSGEPPRTPAAKPAAQRDTDTHTDTAKDSAPEPAAEPAAPAEPSPALLRARRELDRLEAALAEVEDRHADAERDYEDAARAEAAAHQTVADLRAELIAAEQAERDARQRARTARRAREDTERELRDARRRQAVARERLAALEH